MRSILNKKIIYKFTAIAVSAAMLLSGYGSTLPSSTVYASEVNTVEDTTAVEAGAEETTINEIETQSEGAASLQAEAEPEDLVLDYQRVLLEDLTVNSLTIGADVTLDLNGHTLTVNSDLIQPVGNIKINGGKLIVNGDYRLQTIGEKNGVTTYSESTGQLIMNDENDYVLIHGSYINDCKVTNQVKNSESLTAGIMEVKGDIIVSSKYSDDSFIPCEAHTILLSGDNAQTIDIANDSYFKEYYSSYINNLEINNTSQDGVTLANKVIVNGTLKQNDCKITGQLGVTVDTVIDGGIFYGDVLAVDYIGVTNHDLTINGNLIVDNDIWPQYTRIINNLTVTGDMVGNGKRVILYDDNVHIYGESLNANYEMSNAAAYLTIEGNLTCGSMTTLTNGTMEVKGNIEATKITASSNHKTILSGEQKQTVTSSDSITFGTIELRNYSDEGVEFDKPFYKSNLIRNGCNLSYGNVEGEFGWTLTEDYIHEGDLILLEDTLDLNGHTLTVNGDIIHFAGAINVNGGQLIVNGSYRQESFTEAEDGTREYDISSGVISLNNENDYVYIQENLVSKKNSVNIGSINKGVLEIKGNVDTSYFATYVDSTVIFSGDELQAVKGSNLSMGNVSFENQGQGVQFLSRPTINGTIKQSEGAIVTGYIQINNNTVLDNNTYTGNVAIDDAAYTVDEPTHIKGELWIRDVVTVNDSLTVDGDMELDYTGKLYLNSSDIKISGDFIQDQGTKLVLSHGTIEIDGDYILENDYYQNELTMTNADDYILVKGNLTGEDSGTIILESGTLEVKGDISLTYKVVAEEAHTLLLSGDKLQTISVTDDTTWGTIELQNYSKDGVYAEKVFSKNKLIRNGCRLRYGNCVGEFGWTLQEDQVWDGDLVIIEDTLDLNGHTLTVNGDFVQQSGDLDLNNGCLIVNGNYRMQTMDDSGEQPVYGVSTARILMDSNDEKIIVEKDLITDTKVSQKDCITDGVIEVKQNVELLNTSGLNSFEMSGESTLLLSGSTEQAINSSNAYVQNITIDNSYSNCVTLSNQLYIKGNIKGGYLSAPINIISTTSFENDTYEGSVNVRQPYQVPNHRITIKGDFVTYNSAVTMAGDSSYLEIYGDLVLYDSLNSLTTGVVDVKGDISIRNPYVSTKNLVLGQGNRFILSGDEPQRIYHKNGKPEEIYFNTLEIKNTSEEGVYSDYYFRCKTLIDEDNKLSFSTGDYENGYTLTSDVTVSGDYSLGYGTLDLNGHTLTVDGNLYNAGAAIRVNGGKLIINGNYSQYVYNKIGNNNIFYKGYGYLYMDNPEDELYVAGNMDFSNRNSTNINKGTITVNGNIYFSIDSYTEQFGEKVILNGDGNQYISGTLATTDMIINTKGTLTLNKNITAEGTLTDNAGQIAGSGYAYINSLNDITNGYYGGNVSVMQNHALERDLVIAGSLDAGRIIDLNGHTINAGNVYVNSTLDINQGMLNCEKSLVVNKKGILQMQNESDMVCVGENLTFKSNTGHSSYMTAGTLELNGNFTDTLGYSFTPSGTHKTVLGLVTDKESVQTVSFPQGSTASRFNTLVLRKKSDKYSFSRDVEEMAVEVIYEVPDYDEIAPADKLVASSYDSSSVTIEFECNSFEGTVGYRIFRDGELIGSCSQNTYTDTGLAPDTTYVYQVYPFDKYWILAQTSPTLEITTLKDDEAPQRVEGLAVSYLTGAKVGLSWNSASDNYKVKEYNVYKNGNLEYTTDECSIFDENVTAGEVYKYQISAVDMYGNESEYSEPLSITPSAPVIKSVSPLDGAVIKTKEIDLKVSINKLFSGGRYNVDAYYYDETVQDWIIINQEAVSAQDENVVISSATIPWKMEHLQSEVDVKCVVTDEDGCTSTKTLTYHIDNVPPSAPTNPQILSDNGVIKLNWDVSTSYDCNGYNIYRRPYNADAEFELIHTIKDHYEGQYKDKNVQADTFYEYAITAVDTNGNESEKSQYVVAKVVADKQPPEIESVTPETGRIHGTSNLSITVSDNIAPAQVKLYERSEGETEWTSIATLDAATGRCSYAFDTTTKEDGVYYYKFVAVDINENESAEEYTRRYEIDNTGIAKIKLADNTVGSTYVQLRWEDVAEADFGYFQVEQYNSGSYKVVGKSTDVLGYTVTGLNPNTSYRFRVVGYDNLGNRGISSDIVYVTTNADTLAPAIDAIYPTGSIYKDSVTLMVRATDNYDIAKVAFYYSYDGESYTLIKEVNSNTVSTREDISCVWNTSDINEGTVYVRYEVYDKAGNKNAPLMDGSDITKELTIDRTAPATPQNLMATANEGYITISWDKPVDKDIAYYKLYRKTLEDDVYKPVGGDIKTANYHDTSVEFGTTYMYKLSAVDQAGNTSALSECVVATSMEDRTNPVIQGVSPANTSVIRDGSTLTIIAKDNGGLKKLTADILYENTWVNILSADASGEYFMQEEKLSMAGMPEGEYTIRIMATDEAGNNSSYVTYTYTLDNTAPTSELKASQGDMCINLSMTKPDAEDFAGFKLYRRVAGHEDNPQSDATEEYQLIYTGKELSYTDSSIEPWVYYEYKLEVLDRVGNIYETQPVTECGNDNDTEAPSAMLPDSVRVAAGMEVMLDGGESTDNVGIKSYHWELSDGTTYTGSQMIHAFDEVGVHNVTLTVKDRAGNESKATTQVQVIKNSGCGTIELTVIDELGNPVPYAYVYLNDTKNSDKSYKTNKDGKVTISARTGDYLIAAYKANYIPKDMEITVNEYKTNEYTLVIPKGEIVVGDFEIHKMSLQEMVEAGVDFSAPENMHTYTMLVELAFAEKPIPEIIEYVGGASGGGYYDFGEGSTGAELWPSGGGGGGTPPTKVSVNVIPPSEEYPIEQPIIVYVKTAQTVSWLKDMYSVELGVLNTADTKYVIENSSATIDLPEGVSLASTLTGQSYTLPMGEIKGQERKTVSWIVKGDNPGSYKIGADFSGTLQPFNCPVNAYFSCEQQISVENYSGLHITVMPEYTGYTGEDYYIQFKITNNTGRPLYKFTTSLGPYTEPGSVNEVYLIELGSDEKELYDSYRGNTQCIGELSKLSQTPVLYGDEKIMIDTLADGQTIYGTYCCGFPGVGDPTEVYYELIDHMVTAIQGDDLGVSVSVEPISGHISKVIVRQELRESLFGDPVDVTTGAYLDNYEAISITGDNILSLDLAYSSMASDVSGELGYGWSHNFESYIVENYGMIHYYTSPSSCASFVTEDALSGIKYGTMDGNSLILSEDMEGAIRYRSITTGMEGYVLIKNTDGTYTLETPAGYIYSYDTEGRLAKMVTEGGSSVTITHADEQIIITEDRSGNRLKLDYANGRLISVTDNTGRAATFAYTEGYLTSITNPIGETVNYEYDEAGRLTVGRNHNGAAFVTNTYDESGRVVKQSDDRGYEIGFTYTDTDKGTITECKAADGSITTVESDLCGNITKVTNSEGAVTSYQHDRYGNTTKIVDAYGNVSSYGYDESGNMTSYCSDKYEDIVMEYDNQGNVTSVRGTDGDSTDYSYDDSGNIVRVANGEAAYSNTYDDYGRIISQTRGGKGTASFTYSDGKFQPSTATDENGNISYMDYDSRGNLISVKNALGYETRYEYDLMNRITKTIYPNGGEVSFTYDLYGNITSVTDAMGYVTSYSYDVGGRMISATYPDESTETYGYDANGNMISITSADGKTISYEYDTLGNITKVTYPDNTTEEYTYDILGNMLSSTDILGNKSIYSYDDTGKLIGATTPAGGSVRNIYGTTESTLSQIQGISDDSGRAVSYTYDHMGNVTSVTDMMGYTSYREYNPWGELLSYTDPNGNITTYTYDNVGLCTSVTAPDGTVTGMEYDSCGRVEKAYVKADEGEALSVSYTYDSVGNVKTYTDELGNTTSYEYDLNGNITKVTDSEGVVTAEYTYDCMGKVLQEKTSDGIVIAYSYNKSDLVEKVTLTSASGEEKAYTYTYDDMGRVLTVTDPAGNISSQSYDLTGNITELIYPEGGGIEYGYDSLGRLTSETLSIGTTNTYEYNAENLLTTFTNGRGQETDYAYDDLGRISSFTDEMGTVSYTYDGNGNVLTVSEKLKDGSINTITRTYDCMDRVTSYTDYQGNTVKYGYDELGNLISLTYPGGEIVRYDYDSVGLLTTVTDEDGLVTSYSYDKLGRLISTTKPDGSVETNIYDKSSRLLERTVVTRTGELINKYSYTYDDWGNILSIGYESSFEADSHETTFTSASMTYDDSNRMLTYNGEELRYDDDGNMTYGPIDGVMTEMEYDCRNRLIRAGDVAYTYDAENIRIATETPDYVEEYVTDSVGQLSQTLVIERIYKTGDKTEVESYIYGNGLIYEKSSESGLLIYHFDHLGSTTAITDADGSLVYGYSYGTYGELAETTEYSDIAPKVRFLYNGQLGVITDDNGLYYMRQRYYNPELKRFINQDILTGTIGNSASLNRYSYVEGNPVSYTDPFGLSPFSYISQPLHNVLDWAGVIPVIGFGFDFANAMIYVMEGNVPYAAFTLIGGNAGGLAKLAVKNGKKTIIGGAFAAIFLESDAGAGLKEDLTNLGDEYARYRGFDQMSDEQVAAMVAMEIFLGAKSGIGDVKPKTKNVDIQVDDIIPDNASAKMNKLDADDMVPDKTVVDNSLQGNANKPKVHGNSKNSTNKNHVYVIVNKDGSLVKVGISGQPINKNGTSPRANPQVNKLNKNGMDTHAVVVETGLSRTEALDLEQKITDKHAVRNGGMMPSIYHKRPSPSVNSVKEYYEKYKEPMNKSKGGRY